MAGYAIVALEGVLARASDATLLSQPIPNGITLYQALKKVYKIAIATSERDKDKVTHWLAVHGVKDYITVVRPDKNRQLATVIDDRRDGLLELRAAGCALDLLVDSSPAVVAMAMHQGVTGLLFASPAYARPEFRPDAATSVRQWDAIATEVAEQARLRGREPVATADLYE